MNPLPDAEDLLARLAESMRASVTPDTALIGIHTGGVWLAHRLHKALALNPDGMDPNYFIGELLFEQGEYSSSLQHLQKAMAAPSRPDRPVADAGRRAEINALVAKVRSKLK